MNGYKRVAVVAASTIASMATLAGCTGETRHEADPWSANFPEVPEVSQQPANLCMEPDQQLPAYHPSELLTADYDSVFENGNRGQFDSLSFEEVLQVTEHLSTEYGLSITFPEAPPENSHYDFGSISEDPEAAQYAISANLLSIVEAVRYFSPELIKALNLSEIAFVRDIVRKDELKHSAGTIEQAGGLYDSSANRIYIDMASFLDSNLFTNTKSTIVHEVIHAIDNQLLCGYNDLDIDQALTQHNTTEYIGLSAETGSIEEELIMPNPNRVFTREYGASNPSEDRATLLEWTFTERGLIQPSDPDADSPLAKKQAELVRRLDELNPGIKDFLQMLTVSMRNGTAFGYNFRAYLGIHNELDLLYMSEHFPGEYTSVPETFKRLVKFQTPVEVLTNGVLEVQRPYSSEPMIIQNPIILRSTSGEINAVGWSSEATHGSVTGANDDTEIYLNGHFFDQTRMRIITNDGSSPQFESGPITANQETDGSESGYEYTKTSISVNGRRSEEIRR